MGNCGWENSSGDLVLAIGKGLYDRTGGSHCGQVKFYLPSYCYRRLPFFKGGEHHMQWENSVWDCCG